MFHARLSRITGITRGSVDVACLSSALTSMLRKSKCKKKNGYTDTNIQEKRLHVFRTLLFARVLSSDKYNSK